MEDLQVTRNAPGQNFGEDTNGKYIIGEVIKDWMDQLMVPVTNRRYRQLPRRIKHPLPTGVKWITCQFEACVIAKMEVDDVARGS